MVVQAVSARPALVRPATFKNLRRSTRAIVAQDRFGLPEVEPPDVAGLDRQLGDKAIRVRTERVGHGGGMENPVTLKAVHDHMSRLSK